MVPKDATKKYPSVSEGTTGDKDSGSIQPLPDMEPIPPHGDAHSQGTDPADQAKKTYSVHLEGSRTDYNEGKPSSEGEPDGTQSPSLVDMDLLLNEESEEEVFDFEEDEALVTGEDMDTDDQPHTDESSQHPKQPTSSPPPEDQQPSSPEHPLSSSSSSSYQHNNEKSKSSGSSPSSLSPSPSSSGYQHIDNSKPVTSRAIWELLDWNKEWLYSRLEETNSD